MILPEPENPSPLPDLATMPKAELHVHLEGASRWNTIREALHRHIGVTLPQSPHFYAPEFRFADFAEFLGCFRNYIYPWLQAPSGYAELIQDVVDLLVAQRIRYVELNFNAGSPEQFDLDLDKVLYLLEEGVERARQSGTVIRIIAGISRQEGTQKAARQVRRLVNVPIISGFDLHGVESPETRAHLFREAFAPAREAGKKIKAHAGEMDGPESIRAAVEQLGVDQIGHGTSAIRDPQVVDLLVERRVLVEMCPTSNERLRGVSHYLAHPILELDAAGVAVTVNSDDPSWFGLNLTEEMVRLRSERGVTVRDLAKWTRNAFEKAILDEETRTSFLAELEAWLTLHGLPGQL